MADRVAVLRQPSALAYPTTSTTLIVDDPASTTHLESIWSTVSRPPVADAHWDFMISILAAAARAARSRSTFVVIARKTSELDAASAKAPTVKMSSPTIVSMRV